MRFRFFLVPARQASPDPRSQTPAGMGAGEGVPKLSTEMVAPFALINPWVFMFVLLLPVKKSALVKTRPTETGFAAT